MRTGRCYSGTREGRAASWPARPRAQVAAAIDTPPHRSYTAPNLVGHRVAIPIYGIARAGSTPGTRGYRMGMWVGRGRKARVAYGFDDIALVPGAITVNPNEVDISWELCGRRFDLPIIAAAMDGVVGPRLAIEMGRLGGLAVLNLEGIFSRYANPETVLHPI